jgi:Ohr subfamily peroxiredoxin
MSSTPAPRIVLDRRLYTTSATSTGGRSGRVRSSDGVLDLAIQPPVPGSTATNPEQLFAAGYAACFGSALALVARKQKIEPGPFTITAHVALGPAGAGFGLAVELVAELPELAREQAEALVRAAHEVCPYSNATRGNIAVDVRVA